MAQPSVAAPEKKEDTSVAPRWKVILHDDPVTSFEFVRTVLRQVFSKSESEAYRITREAHDTGAALVAVLSFEQAEFRCEQVRSLSRPHGYPLTVTMEPAD